MRGLLLLRLFLLCNRVGFACFDLAEVEPEALWDLPFPGFDEGDESSG